MATQRAARTCPYPRARPVRVRGARRPLRRRHLSPRQQPRASLCVRRGEAPSRHRRVPRLHHAPPDRLDALGTAAPRHARLSTSRQRRGRPRVGRAPRCPSRHRRRNRLREVPVAAQREAGPRLARDRRAQPRRRRPDARDRVRRPGHGHPSPRRQPAGRRRRRHAGRGARTPRAPPRCVPGRALRLHHPAQAAGRRRRGVRPPRRTARRRATADGRGRHQRRRPRPSHPAVRRPREGAPGRVRGPDPLLPVPESGRRGREPCGTRRRRILEHGLAGLGRGDAPRS